MQVIVTSLNYSHCRACHAPIAWFRLWPSERPHPFNTPCTIDDLRQLPDRARAGAFHQIGDVDPRDSHFTSCPQAARFRRQAARPLPRPRKNEPAPPQAQQKGLFDDLPGPHSPADNLRAWRAAHSRRRAA